MSEAVQRRRRPSDLLWLRDRGDDALRASLGSDLEVRVLGVVPDNHLAVALLTFNVGVEFGQLLVVLAAWFVTRALAHWRGVGRTRKPALYAMGGVAAYWAIGRISAMLA